MAQRWRSKRQSGPLAPCLLSLPSVAVAAAVGRWHRSPGGLRQGFLHHGRLVRLVAANHLTQFVHHGAFLVVDLFAADAQEAAFLRGVRGVFHHLEQHLAVSGGVFGARLAAHQPRGLPHALNALRFDLFHVAGVLLGQVLGVGRGAEQFGGHRLHQRRARRAADTFAHGSGNRLRFGEQPGQSAGAGGDHSGPRAAWPGHDLEPLVCREVVFYAHAASFNGSCSFRRL
ncbi:hypothetical protein DR_0869 [Deinococcus radiodurans R1 = ATCC 13939 = DSM 20539]|uniref:Secreted protein n=1 Tax=Deinococcus radiodurans (strain ATCC 13939 / DSM 20539 / JCM 16871 / CCUG 27074 / LMG 4051 / NBRC 15346 / NCIMB 9279 / VKM B-1422 / R1) TaxID=243230 RepID=Q9RW00_DEIRA|nr:hypothetical protein DR_0869 [Deinococcus radiodurans R1 = ATCC 13939 = DSM 20539]